MIMLVINMLSRTSPVAAASFEEFLKMTYLLQKQRQFQQLADPFRPITCPNADV